MLGANTKERKMEMALEKLVTQVSKLQRREGGVDLSSLHTIQNAFYFYQKCFQAQIGTFSKTRKCVSQKLPGLQHF